MKFAAQTFSEFYSNLAESLLKNLPSSPNKFDMNYVHQYYNKLGRKDDFNLTLTTEKNVLEILQCINISKVAGMEKILRKFLKEGANTLAKPIAEICNTSIFSGRFPSDYKIVKLKPFYKKGPKPILEILDSFLSYHCYQWLLKEKYAIG